VTPHHSNTWMSAVSLVPDGTFDYGKGPDQGTTNCGFQNLRLGEEELGCRPAS
jgi:hypothetical protein